ncbi:phasin family protein [Paracoccus tegillarcae]|nr:phasin family protein [Paracoccus tegillarcae]
MTTTTTKTEQTSVRAKVNDAREIAGDIGGAVSAGSRAYVNGLMELGRTFGGFGREVLSEAGDHVRATFNAKCMREVAELQASYVQHRVEMSATHSKEIVDLARVKTEAVIAPFADLVKKDQKAA